MIGLVEVVISRPEMRESDLDPPDRVDVSDEIQERPQACSTS